MKRILVVEDNRANLRLVRDVLERAGYLVLGARDAEAGIALARSERPDLVLMDIQLPGKDGLTATRVLKRDPATRDIPVVAVTAQAMRGDRERLLAAGCDHYLDKPIRYRALLALLGRLFRTEVQGSEPGDRNWTESSLAGRSPVTATEASEAGRSQRQRSNEGGGDGAG